MGHKYVKEEDTFSTSQNGTVPKPTAQEVTDNKVLRADGSWAAQSGGGSTVSFTQTLISGTKIGTLTIDETDTDLYAPTPEGYNDILGLEIDYDNGTFTRLLAAEGLTPGDDFNNFFYSKIKRCNLGVDGTVVYYEDEDGYSVTYDRVMVEIPLFYYRFEPLKLTPAARGNHVNKARYFVSEYEHPGFKPHPWFVMPDGTILDKAYYSAFEGSLYDTSASAAILDDAQVMDATADLLMSRSGAKPASGLIQNLTKANLQAMAENIGTGYGLADVYAEMAITWLMMIEYATLDFQRTAIGYGVVSKASGSGNESNVNGLAVLDSNGSTYAGDTTGLLSCAWRGIENPYGNIWENIQAINIYGDGTMLGGEAYICKDFAYDESKHSDNYEGVGFYAPASDGYIKYFGYAKESFDWVLLPSEIGGSNALPVGDYCYRTSNLNRYKIAILSGNWPNGPMAGRSYWRCTYDVGFRNRDLGGRLEYRNLQGTSGGGGGGGSTVTYTQTLTSGAECGTININGVDTKIYAPSQLHTYSNSEQRVGTWINNKPIYEITLSQNFTGTDVSINLTSYNIDMLVDVRARGVQPSSNNIIMMNFYSADYDKSLWYYRPSDHTLQVRFGRDYGKGQYYITLQYTKTTDTV